MDICASMTAAFGVASLNSVGRMGASSSIRVRRSNETGFIAGVSPVMAHSMWKQLGFHKGWHGTPVKPPISFSADTPCLIRCLTAQRRHQEETNQFPKVQMQDYQPEVRTQILKVADRLFYEQGIRAIGVNAIAAEAGISKKTLYQHFASKDDLIVAYLQGRF